MGPKNSLWKSLEDHLSQELEGIVKVTPATITKLAKII